jgi:hypothetical protein
MQRYARGRGVYPLLDFVGVPRHPASSKPYPLGELAGSHKPCDMREAVRNAIDRLKFLRLVITFS